MPGCARLCISGADADPVAEVGPVTADVVAAGGRGGELLGAWRSILPRGSRDQFGAAEAASLCCMAAMAAAAAAAAAAVAAASSGE